MPRRRSLIYGVPIDEVTSDMRRMAKVMNFGVAYGLSAFGISRQTEMSMDEGNQFIGDYFGTYAKVREYLDETVARAKETGYAETLLGRRRYLPELMSPHYPVRQAGERMALNMPVQGTTSDIINTAMVGVQKRLEGDGFNARMLLQVHDELVFETPRGEEQALSAMLHEVMPSALDLIGAAQDRHQDRRETGRTSTRCRAARTIAQLDPFDAAAVDSGDLVCADVP